jgi:RimJ/RimL family protein N-acetyltransferase
MAPPVVRLRPVEQDDLPVLFEHQLDPEALRMAAFEARDRAAFLRHWEKILRDPACLVRTVLADDAIAGNVGSWDADGARLVGYWIGRESWGRGVATAALSAFLELDRTRPLHALVAAHNVGSIRVLEKCGFVRTSDGVVTADDGVEELEYRLGDPPRT